MKEELALVGGFGAAGVGPLVVVTVLSPLRGHPLSTGIVVFVLIVAIAIAAILAGPMIGAVATVNAELWFNFLFVPPYGTLKASGVVGWSSAVVLVAGLAIVGIARRSGAQDQGATPPTGTASDAMLPPSGHIERVVRLIESGTDRRDLISAVQIELTSLLVTRRCRFEAGSSGPTTAVNLPRLERDGTVSGFVGGPERLEIPVRTSTRFVGRFVLDLTPGMSIPFDRKVIALIVADHLAAAIVTRDTSSPHTEELRWSPY